MKSYCLISGITAALFTAPPPCTAVTDFYDKAAHDVTIRDERNVPVQHLLSVSWLDLHLYRDYNQRGEFFYFFDEQFKPVNPWGIRGHCGWTPLHVAAHPYFEWLQ